MLRERLNLFKRLVFAADLCLVALAFQLSIMISSGRLAIETDIFSYGNLLLPAIILWGMVLWFVPECYTIRLRNIGDIIGSLARAGILSTGLFIGYIFLSGSSGQRRFQIVLFSGLSIILVILFRLVIVSMLERFRSLGYNYRTVTVIGTGKLAREFTDRVLSNSRFGLRVIGFIDWERRKDLWRYRDIPCIGSLEDLPGILKNNHIDWAVFAVGRKFLGMIESSINICEEMGIQTAVLADFFPMKLARKSIGSFFDSPLVCYDSAPRDGPAIIAKNAIDRLLAVIGLVLATPLMSLAAVAVKITSPGPAIFRQERCGLNGRKFTLYKFRTMVDGAERRIDELAGFNEMGGAAFKMKDDPRVTRIGKLLRRTSIDELPQLFNILKGDMSIVGPRPPLASEVAGYDLWQRRKLSMKPGLTCLWQVNGRSNVQFDQWMKLDLKYIDNWSLWEDAKIILKTMPAVLRGTGAR